MQPENHSTLRLQKLLWSVQLLQFPHRVLLYTLFNTRPGVGTYLRYDQTWLLAYLPGMVETSATAAAVRKKNAINGENKGNSME